MNNKYWEARYQEMISGGSMGSMRCIPDFGDKNVFDSFDKLIKGRIVRDKTIIDYGCGIANNLPYLMMIFGFNKYIGMDVSQTAIAEAQKRYAVQFQVIDIENELPECDYIWASWVFQHILTDDDAIVVLDKFFNSLPIGGKAFIVDSVGGTSNGYSKARTEGEQKSLYLGSPFTTELLGKVNDTFLLWELSK